MAPFLFMVQSVLVLCDIKLLVKGASININLCKEENQWCLINTLSSVNLCLNVLKCGFYGIQNSPNQKLWLEFGILCLNKEIWGLVNQACLPLLSLRSDKNDRPMSYGKYCLYKVLNFSWRIHVEEKCSFVMKSAFPTMIFFQANWLP